HSFYWLGIDGTGVLTHFPPEDTYNAYMTCEKLAAAQNKYAQSGECNEFMSLYGIGDGGCGPSSEFVERALRLQNFEGSPKVKFGRACDFFERLSKVNGLPKWSGELYLELHRGTLTNQARNKRYNRKCEQSLVELETLYSMLPAEKYPDDLFDMMWKTVLINQFHDILPGSSVNCVYGESSEDYEAVIEMCGRLGDHAGRELFDGDENTYTVVNTLSYPVSGLFELPWEAETYETQSGFTFAEIPALGSVEFKKGKGKKLSSRMKNDFVLENELIRYEFDSSGRLISAFDRELEYEFMSGFGNVLSLYGDYPVRYEAWDIDKDYVEKKVCEAECVSFKKISQGKLFCRAKIEFKIGKSAINQTVTLKKGSKRLDFECEVDWNESRMMLRSGFDSAVCPSDAAYDIQYGYIRRANHTNTSWEQAKFEVAHQKYFDLSKRDRGIALLNDCKYGCHVSGGFFDLALLRSSKYPDFYADLGRHVFTYALLPHSGDLVASDVISEAAALNRTPSGFAGKLNFRFPVSAVTGSIELCAMKKAAKSDDTVVRFVETSGYGCEAEIGLCGHRALTETDLIEWKQGETFKAVTGKVKLKFRPFEIRTFFLK
ncbi:MAG: glycoside hydrolase family 38 C-terminal domain-containing protein, partial [Victivallaceae bacterium]|nr:glycoside hydrolase family 38 C-terminal domain-containing protein [Victivallaceae bacterium]